MAEFFGQFRSLLYTKDHKMHKDEIDKMRASLLETQETLREFHELVRKLNPQAHTGPNSDFVIALGVGRSEAEPSMAEKYLELDAWNAAA